LYLHIIIKSISINTSLINSYVFLNEPTWYSGIVVRSDDSNELAKTICIEVTWYCVNIFPCHVDVKLSVAKYPTSKITPVAQVVMSKEK